MQRCIRFVSTFSPFVNTLRGRACLHARFCTGASETTAAADPRVCIVGAGPSGFYTAKYLLKEVENLHVDLLDRLPTPYGLVRSGVAPDHQATKSVMADFAQTLSNSRCNFWGNVEVGQDVTVHDLLSAYDAVVLAYGASGDRRLGVEGETLEGVHSARKFVNWYNGHPDYSSVDFASQLKSSQSCVVIGQGNVAIDVSRVILTKPDDLRSSDICEHALEALEESKISHVSIIGRRGPAQAAFTIKELRELTRLDGVRCVISRDEIEKGSNSASLEEIANSRPLKRKFELLKTVAAGQNQDRDDGDRALSIGFFLNPTRILESETKPGSVGAVECDVTRLEGEAGRQKAVVTGEKVALPADLVLTSVGYQSSGIGDVPFDEKRSVVPSSNGRVVGIQGDQVTGVYVTGWLKRGPTGIIGTNIPDAKETAQSICEDFRSGIIGRASMKSGDIRTLLQNGKPVVSFEGWKKIEAVEHERGSELGKPREKIVDWKELLRVAGPAQ
mmetsp:Transcript_14244/g.34734  ORF Transcript_14244/g.34734 Transcript_14244/m.34734 type:complete len:502 (+) Transcript_14244:226-1731(+)